MFRDLGSYHPRPQKPEPPARRLTPAQERLVVWVLGFNVLMLVLGPFCGSSVVEAVLSLIQRR
ncbi:MAG: hypothetical protein PW791_09490 [Neorhizobium sp.]|nr:hypothetical protein [Neorhizobium sp.]